MSAPCLHGKRKSLCKKCGGGSICEHGRRRSFCKDCRGGSICEHGRRRYQCKDCGGPSICCHGRQKKSCKSCETVRRTHSRPSVYQHLDDYAVACGCFEREVIMRQISCDVNGDFLFKNVYDIDISGKNRQPIPYAAPLHSNRCLNHNAVVFSHAPPRPLQSAGAILQSPSSTALTFSRRPCSAS